ncbi:MULTISPECIES: prolyl oligopeptidase family serine peptidase [Streptomyces]|uniref:S9 family peptidase n=1 Tax=Streptomyces eurythermus TaxID=42237 RepID=A0ABW6Z4K2_9ACTN|nr:MULTISPECIES: prolyl oligopeptidase family serine peptidase [Streptomyces]QIS69640.1 S9 family peptidase [Streptomyces sp. DSM 40868]
MAADARNLTGEPFVARSPDAGPAGAGRTSAALPKRSVPPPPPAPGGRTAAFAAPARVPLPDASGPREATTRLIAHGCWYPSADPSGTRVAFICDRGGVPQLWTGPVDGEAVHLLDDGPDPVTEVSWSPDGRWIAYTTAPGGGEHTRVLCVRPDGGGRHILAGAEPGSSAHLGCWAYDGSAIAVTVAVPTAEPGPDATAQAGAPGPGAADGRLPAHWPEGAGHTKLLGPVPHTAPGPGLSSPVLTVRTAAVGAPGGTTAPAAGFGDGLSAYLIDPDGVAAPVLLAVEKDAATLRVCDLSRDGALALLRRGPRGRREAVVLRTADLEPTCVMPVADGDPWIGGFSPRADTLWLRSDAHREFAVLLAAGLDPQGRPRGWSVAASRDSSDLELLRCARDGDSAVLAWNVRGVSELEVLDTSAIGGPADLDTSAAGGPVPDAGASFRAEPGRDGDAAGRPGAGTVPPRPVSLPHEVVTRVTAAGPRPLLALSGSRRRPGIWWLPDGATPVRTPWSSRDEDAVPPGRPPVRPVPLSPTARDGLPLHGWYYRAPGRAPGEPAPCVIHLHGGPEDQERPVLDPLYHEILGRGVDVFAPDVRGSSGYGRSFVDADLGRGRFAAIDDVADCAAHAVLAGLADPARLAVMGRSYGGYLTFASLVWHPDLFRTGIAVCGMSDLATFFAGTEPWIAQSAAHKYGHPERDRELLRALSPMSRIDALRAPVLAVHGEHDTNVPPGESEQFVRAARERGVTAELLTLPDEGHEFLRADNRRLFRRAAADWLQRQLST